MYIHSLNPINLIHLNTFSLFLTRQRLGHCEGLGLDPGPGCDCGPWAWRGGGGGVNGMLYVMGFGVYGLGLRIQGLGFKVQDLGFRI